MRGSILDGRAIAAELRAQLAERAAAFATKWGRAPGLEVVLVGDDPASHLYVRNKQKAAMAVGIRSAVHRLPPSTTLEALLAKVSALNADPTVDGILVQLPLPDHLDPHRVLDAIDPAKDVDGLHPTNAGLLWSDREGLRPCTPLGCIYLLDRIGARLEGARALVVGRSRLVGKPIAAMLLARHATVTVAHSRTRDLEARVREAEIVVAAAGKAELIRGSWIREGAIVIDVGINRREDGSLVGDVEFESARERAAWITPVPGGVGPMTIAMLLSNTLDAAERRTRA